MKTSDLYPEGFDEDMLIPTRREKIWTSGCEICENCKRNEVCIERRKEDKEIIKKKSV